MSANTAVAVLGAFVLLDLLKFWISETMGTGAVWLLQQDVRALRRSVATATTPRSLATRAARERLLRDKERALLRRQTPPSAARSSTPTTSPSPRASSARRARWPCGANPSSVSRESVWPLGRWLAVPTARSGGGRRRHPPVARALRRRQRRRHGGHRRIRDQRGGASARRTPGAARRRNPRRRRNRRGRGGVADQKEKIETTCRGTISIHVSCCNTTTISAQMLYDRRGRIVSDVASRADAQTRGLH